MLILMATQEYIAQGRTMKLDRFFRFGFELLQTLVQEGNRESWTIAAHRRVTDFANVVLEQDR